jgi:hypothetical protein
MRADFADLLKPARYLYYLNYEAISIPLFLHSQLTA